MSNLIKTTSVNLPKEVSSKSRSVYQANSSSMIKNIDDMNIVINSIHQAINKTIFEKGVNINIDDLNQLKIMVQDDILKDFSTLTIQDINLCFSMGVRGNLGEYYGLNVVTFYGWLKKYKEEVIPEAINEVLQHLPPAIIEEPKIDYKQLDLEKVENICNAINQFVEKEVYEFNDYGNIHFNLLNKLGYFDDISELENNELREQAKQSYINEMKDKNLSLLNQGKNFQMVDLNKLLESIEHGEKDTETIIEIYYRKLSLKRFIVNFSTTGKNFNKFKNELITKVKKSYGK